MADGTWTLVREARDDSWPQNIYFRVHTVFNKKTNLYVMWVNLNGGKADYAVGTSSDPEGPFKFVTYANAAVSGAGDFDILIDDDGEESAYIIYTGTRTGHTMSLEKLDPTYTQSLAASRPPPPTAEKGETQPVLGERQIIRGKCLASYSDSSRMAIVGGPVKSNTSSGIIGMPFVEAQSLSARGSTTPCLETAAASAVRGQELASIRHRTRSVRGSAMRTSAATEVPTPAAHVAVE